MDNQIELVRFPTSSWRHVESAERTMRGPAESPRETDNAWMDVRVPEHGDGSRLSCCGSRRPSAPSPRWLPIKGGHLATILDTKPTLVAPCSLVASPCRRSVLSAINILLPLSIPSSAIENMCGILAVLGCSDESQAKRVRVLELSRRQLSPNLLVSSSPLSLSRTHPLFLTRSFSVFLALF